MTREFDVLFRINGAMGDAFSNAVRAAQNSLQNLGRINIPTSNIDRLRGQLQNLSRARVNLEQFKNLKQSINDTSSALVRSRLDTARLNTEWQNQKKTTEQMARAFDRLKEVYAQNKGSMSTDERVNFQAAIRAAKEELAAQQNRERAAKSAYTAESSKSSQLSDKLARQQSQLATLRANLQAAGVSASDMAAAESRLQSQIDRTTAAIERQAQLDAARKRQNDASQNFSYAFGNLQAAIGTASTIMSPFTSAVKTSMDFNAAMSEVKAITGATGENFEKLKQQAKDLGASTAFSASEAASAMKFLGMAGWDTTQIMRGMPAMLNLALAGQTDLAQTADIVSDGLTAFNMDLKKTPDAAERFADVMAATATSANTSVSLMGETFKYAGAVAGALGYSIEDVSLATALMANASVKGSMAGTALRSTFTRLAKPPKEAANAMNALGISITNADGTMKPFRNVLKDMREGFKKLTPEQKAAYAAQIAGQEAMAGFLAMMNASDADFAKLEKNIDNSKGKAKEIADVQSDNLKGALKTFSSAFEGLQIAVGDVFEKPLQGFVSNAASSLGMLTLWIGQHKELVASAAKAAAAVSAVIVGIAGYSAAAAGVEYLAASYAALKLRIMESAAAQRLMAASQVTWSGMFAGISARASAAGAAVTRFFATASAGSLISGAASSIQSLGSAFLSAGRAAMGFVFSPIGVALMALGAAGYYVYTHWSQVAPVFNSLAATLGGSLQGAIQTIQSSFTSLGESVSRLGPAISVLGSGIFAGLAIGLNAVVNLAATLISTFANAAAAVVSLFSGVGNAIASLLAGNFDKAWEYLKTGALNALNFIGEAIKSLFGGIGDTFANLLKPLDILKGSAKVEVAQNQNQISPLQNPNQNISQEISAALSEQNANLANVFGEQNAALAETLKAAQIENSEGAKGNIQEIAQTLSANIKESNADTARALGEGIKPEIADATAKFSEALKSSQMENLESSKLSAQELAQTLGQTLTDSNASSMEAISNALQAGQEQKNLQTEQIQNSLDTTASSMQTLDAQFQTSQGTLTNFDGALQVPIGNLSSLGDAAGSAASSISGLGSAASAAISSMQSAASSISAAAASAKPASNAQGGIYSKGAFLTTFAEKSPEAAIPIDNSQRAIDLWTKTGQMLGQLPGKANFATENKSTAQSAREKRAQQVMAQYERAKKAGTLNQKVSTPPTVQIPKVEQPKVPAEELKRRLEKIKEAEKYLPKQKNSPIYPQKNYPRSIFAGSLKTSGAFDPLTRTQTQARQVSLENFNLENLNNDTPLNPKTTNLNSSPSINVNFSINIQGNANAQDITQGIKSTFPMFEESFEKTFANFNHERARRSF